MKCYILHEVCCTCRLIQIHDPDLDTDSGGFVLQYYLRPRVCVFSGTAVLVYYFSSL